MTDVRPGDRHRCRGCDQILTFDARGFVPPDQLRACLGRCDWVLVERGGVAVGEDDGSEGAGGPQSPAVGST